MDRNRIDWAGLEPLPRVKRQSGATRDDLAARKFNMGKAKHKGRNHLSNQKRRKIAREKAEQARKTNDIVLGKIKSHIAEIRAYWRGERDTHP